MPAGTAPTLIGWMDNWQYGPKLPTSPWRGQMTLPRRLSLLHDAAGLALREEPVTGPLRMGAGVPLSTTLKHHGTATLATTSTPMEFQFTFPAAGARRFGVRLRSDATHAVEIVFDRSAGTVTVDRTQASYGPIAPEFPARTSAPLQANRPMDLRMILDRGSLEVFAQDGTVAITNLLFPPSTTVTPEVFVEGSTSPVTVTGRRWPLRSIW